MPADHPTIGFSDLALTSEIFGLVGHVPGEPHQMTRLTARSRKDIDNVFQRLLDLDDEIVAFKLRQRVPAYLAGDENLPTLRNDAVGVAFGGAQCFGCTISNELLLMIPAIAI